MGKVRSASCFCGIIGIETTGDPIIQGYCHCNSCRAWTGQPFVAYALWPSAQVSVTRGAEKLGFGKRNSNLTMGFCTDCGGNVMAIDASSSLTDVYPMLLEGLDFTPVCHVNYGERAIDMRDGLPKFRDMPERAGGTGEMMAE